MGRFRAWSVAAGFWLKKIPVPQREHRKQLVFIFHFWNQSQKLAGL
jgi:hypothetical protein